MIAIATGNDPADVETQLRAASAAAKNISGGGAQGYHLMNAYIAWADEWTRMLRSRIEKADLERLILVPEYWALRAHTPEDFGQAFMSHMFDELFARESDLLAAAEEIRHESQRWAGRGLDPIAVVLDTNIFLEWGDSLLEQDWHELLGLRPHRFLYLVLTRVVLDELDRHKQSRDASTQGQWRRAHAQAAIRSLWGMFGTHDLEMGYERTDSIPVRRAKFELVTDTIEHVQLDDPDAEILDRARALTAYVPTQVMTFDTGMALRGRAAGVDVVLATQPVHSPKKPKRIPPGS